MIFLSKLPGWWADVNRNPLYCKMGVTEFGYKMWLDIAMFKDDFHENEGLWVLQKDDDPLDDYSGTYQWHWDELETLTQNWSEGIMNHRYELTIKNITQSKSHDDGVKVSCSRVTYYHKVFCSLSKISLIIFRLVPLYFLTNLRRVTYSWSIIQPFGRMHCYLII